MKISVVTPSYNQLPWLKLCVASVADQQGVCFEHIVQDARTGHGLEEWVRAHSNAKVFVESDSGMYDAINKGFLKATGDVVAWLNCDEQYLPRALAKVAAFFESHPKVDVLFGDAVLLSDQGGLLSYRRAILPSLIHTQLAHLNTLSCATFVRRSVIERGFLLKPEWKAIADAVWVADMIKAKLTMAVLPEALSAFTLTSENLGESSLAFKEGQRWKEQTTRPWQRALKPGVVMIHRIRKFLNGAYALRDFSTEIFTQATGVGHRVTVASGNLSFEWSRSPAESGLKFSAWKFMGKLFFGISAPAHRISSKPLPFSIYHPPRWPLSVRLGLPILLAGAILFFEEQSGTSIIVAPMLSMGLMLVMSFFVEPQQLIPFALTFTVAIYWAIHYMQPFDPSSSTDWIRLGLRISGFLTAATLAVLFSKSRCEAKERLDQTIEVITSIPMPVIISDALGVILFANDEAMDLTGLPRKELVGASYPKLFMTHFDEGSAMRDYIKFFHLSGKNTALSLSLGLQLSIDTGRNREIEGRFVCVGDAGNRYMVTVFNSPKDSV